MSDKSHRSPPPRPPGKSTSTGDSQAQRPLKADATKADATKTDATKTDAVKVPAGTRSRTRSGAMRVTTRPDNPLAVFKAHDEQPRRAKPDPAPTAVEAPAPPVPRAPPRVPPPAPRTPPAAAVSNRSLPALSPPTLPHRREASVGVAPPAVSASNQGTPDLTPDPPPADPIRARLDITISAVPHPRLPALTPIEPTPCTFEWPRIGMTPECGFPTMPRRSAR